MLGSQCNCYSPVRHDSAAGKAMKDDAMTECLDEEKSGLHQLENSPDRKFQKKREDEKAFQKVEEGGTDFVLISGIERIGSREREEQGAFLPAERTPRRLIMRERQAS